MYFTSSCLPSWLTAKSCVCFMRVIIISMTSEMFLLSIWKHWKAKCVHTDSRSLLSNGKEKQRVKGSNIFLSFCLSVCCLCFCLAIRPSFVSFCLSAHLSVQLSIYPSIRLSKTERQTDRYSDTGLCSCPQEGITWWSFWRPRAAAHTQNAKQHT